MSHGVDTPSRDVNRDTRQDPSQGHNKDSGQGRGKRLGPEFSADRPADADAEVLADAVAQELARLARLFERARAGFAATCRDGLERAAYLLLARLVAEGPQRLSALAEAMRLAPSTVSRQVASLVQWGLVERRPDPQDGRAARFTVTSDGQRVFAEHRRVRNQHIAAVLADWPGQDVHLLVTLLDRLNTDFENYRTRWDAAGPGTHIDQEGPGS